MPTVDHRRNIVALRMSLQPGNKLAHYEILEPIGKGGMGEVYRAKDSKLGRDVAIKVLPDEFAQDEERLRRFQREAKVLASLNHPNIASIYGLEQSDKTHYLVLELVPGETLAERIARGPIPVEEALEIANKITEALEEAHEQGVVHRDLKPANVKLTEDGKVVVLDFGLAKAFVEDSAEGDSATSMSPTITRDATRIGVILGTAAYMSPEQAKGKRVDRQTDIFALGAVLYEMLTRQKAFPGADVSEVLAAVIKSEPDWSRLPSSGLRRVIERCLHKDARSRFHHIADVRLELEEAVSAPAPGAVPVRKATLPWVLAAVMALTAGLASWRSGPSERAMNALIRLSLNLEASFGSLDGAVLAISPDGTRVVQVARPGPLRLRELGRDEWVPIPETERATMPFFSPDGNWVGFFAAGKLMKVQLDGAGAAVIADLGRSRGASWGPDDIIVFTTGKQLMKISAAGGNPEALTDPSEGEQHYWPDILPNGKGVIFSIVTSADYDDSDIVVQSFETGERRFLVNASFARYAPTGHLVYAREGTLYAIPFDADRLEVAGSGIPVQTGVWVNSAGPGSAHFAVSDTGALVWLAKPHTERRLFLVDLQGKDSAIAAPPQPYEQIRFAPDGRRLAVMVAGDGAGRQIHVYELAQERMSLVTSEFEGPSAGEVFKPIGGIVWSADSKTLAINATAHRQGLNLFLIAADGSGAAERLTEGPGYQFPEAWSVDQKRLLFTDQDPPRTRGMGIFEVNREDGNVRTVLDPGGARAQAVLSPDGSWLAYTSTESGRFEVYITRYPDLGERQQVSVQGGTAAVWAPDGRTIYYRNIHRVMRVDVTIRPQLSVGTPEVLFESPYYRSPGYNLRAYDLSPDGRHFAMIRTEEGDAQPTQLQVVLNWFDELERLVPTN